MDDIILRREETCARHGSDLELGFDAIGRYDGLEGARCVGEREDEGEGVGQFGFSDSGSPGGGVNVDVNDVFLCE